MDDKPTGVPSTPKYAWTILAIVFFLSIVLPMQWFSCPPLSANIFETYGLEGAARADFGLLMSYVAITALIAAVVLHEKLSKWFFFGFVCAMAGVALVSLAGVSELHFSPIGALLGVGAALVWGVYSVLVRQLGHMGYRTIPLTCRIFGYGLLFLLVPAVIEGFPSGLSVWMQPVHLANLLFLGLCASATCFVTWNRAVFLLGPVKTSVYIYATPVITIVSSALILHETMTPIMWLGTVLALGGLILSEHREKEKTTA